MTIDPTEDPLYTAQEVAKMFGVTAYTIRTWIDSDRIKAKKIEGRWRIPRSEIRRVANEEHG